ncbi:MAG: replicative DNA helicase [Dethiobacteria bacterium]|nr:replicative DNA helicase [Bacillota bacterium]MDW7729023.1 replicative DNA helicase [Bacillota bacterium]
MVVISDRVPPQSKEAEQSVLGSMIIDRESIFLAAELLTEQDFYSTAHQKIFSGIISLSEKGEPVDLVTLSEELQRKQCLDEIGGRSYLVTLANAVPTAANVQYHSQIVREKSILRALIQTATGIVSRSFDAPHNVDEFLDEAEQMIFEIGKRGKQQGFASLKEVLVQAFDRIEKLYDEKKGVTGISTGFTDLDRLTSGLQNSDLIVIAARPSMGKTTLALNMAQQIAVREKKPTAIFSMEMSKDQLAQRLLCAESQIDAQNMRRGFLSQEEWHKLTRAVGPLSESPLYIDDSASLSVMEVRAKARRLKAEKGLEAIFVDYLQLMRGFSRSESRQQELSEISRALKALAKELTVPVVALSQLSRAVEKRPDRRPILSDLMESGGIEANADLVMFIYRESYYNKDSDKGNIAEINIAKQRNGPTGLVELYFLDRYTKFANVAQKSIREEG